MDMDLLKLILFLEKIDVPINSGQKSVQKSVYIMQKAGLSFGYSFAWYAWGVHSPELRDDIDKGCWLKDKTHLYEIKNTYVDTLKNVAEILEIPNRMIDRTEWIDFIATILYFSKEGMDIDEIENAVVEKKGFPLDYFDVAYSRLMRFELVGEKVFID